MSRSPPSSHYALFSAKHARSQHLLALPKRHSLASASSVSFPPTLSVCLVPTQKVATSTPKPSQYSSDPSPPPNHPSQRRMLYVPESTDMSNTRSDAYGGSVEKRSRFALEVTEAVVDASLEYDSRTRNARSNPTIHPPHRKPLSKPPESRLPPRNRTTFHRRGRTTNPLDPSNDFIRCIWSPRPLITAGGYTMESAIEVTKKEDGELVAFGRHFLANFDLPRRLEENLPLNKYDRTRLYIPAERPEPERGCIDYLFYAESGVLASTLADVDSAGHCA
ncbi:hypothetical protein BDQ17DRAFT_1544145 [Cyathus striatus]|nr:hypothetical protein BDQ17DRAFT_1544145 [Cyathus striatus]